MKWIAVGWTRSGADVFLTKDGVWIKEKYAGLVEGQTGHYHTAPIAVFDTEAAANDAMNRSDEMGSCRVIELTEDIVKRLSE